MADLVQIRNTSPNAAACGVNLTFLESIDENTVRAKVNDREITFVYIWEDRFNPHWEYFGNYKIRLCNTFVYPHGPVKEYAYVFTIDPVK